MISDLYVSFITICATVLISELFRCCRKEFNFVYDLLMPAFGVSHSFDTPKTSSESINDSFVKMEYSVSIKRVSVSIESTYIHGYFFPIV